MTFLPIVDRELRLAARRWTTYWARFGVAALAIVLTLGMLSPSFQGVQPTSETGRSLFIVLALLAAGYALMAGVFVTADCLSAEKRGGTLGLLFLTDLTGRDVVFGKLAATSLNAAYGLLAVFPLLALPLLLGGVTVGEFWRMILVLANTLFLSLATGMLVSSLARDGRVAMAGTLAALLILTAGPTLRFILQPPTSTAPVVAAGLLVSPAYAVYLAFDAGYGAAARFYWAAVLLGQGLAWAALALACRIIPNSWKDFAPRARVSRWQERWWRWQRGNPEKVARNREQWLDKNPVLWLARRERHRLAFFWGFIGVALGLWLSGLLALRQFWLQAPVVVLTTFVVHSVIKLWIAWEVSHRLGDERRTGELELLLVTPLDAKDLVQGRVLAIKRQFLIPIVVVLCIDLAFLLFGLSAHGSMALPYLVGIGMFVADSYTLTWVGLWQGLAAPTSARAFARTVFAVLLLPWLMFLGAVAGCAFLFGSWPGVGGLLGCWFAIGYFADLALCGITMERLHERFRLMAGSGGDLIRTR